MALIVAFLLGIANFALHAAVLERRRQLLAGMGWPQWAGRASMVAEFAVLLGALLLVQGGYPQWVWLYAGYTLVNAAGGWLLLRQ
ncbi:hypothetical protein PK98_12455 [Croceibacterium mercuriale]|uniref:Uncharacterized protein n=1 Tax=Croceibacterium mercuriale TaxID=1572751 RepID=A0A0B2BXN8_9SPHN|nr:hypothetical protein [Croceibacterium mercuriale]KHL24737.1 hypothetical protein PK98_12455 [Croceibacterium mercuriale]